MILFFTASAGLLTACVCAALGDGPPATSRAALAILSLASLFYLACSLSILKSKSCERHLFIAVVAVSVLLRICAWSVEPEYTTDYYRYVWDGKVATHGINPYRYPPKARELKRLRTESIYTKINFKQANTGYGPAAEAAFRVLYGLCGDNLAMWRMIFFTVETACAGLLILILAATGLPLSRVAIYSLNPLVLLELCANMHLDVFMIFFMLAAVYAILKSRPRAGSALMAVAALVKFFPVLFLPALLSKYLRERETRKKLIGIAGCAAVFAGVLAIGFAPYIEKGVDIFSGIKFFSTELTITAGSPYYHLFGIIGENAKPAGLLFVFMIAAWGFTSRDDRARLDSMFMICAAVVLFSPVQRAWYFTWALPFCCLRVRWSWIAATCLCMLPYGVMYKYEYLAGMQTVFYSCFYILAAAEICYNLMNRKSSRERQPG